MKTSEAKLIESYSRLAASPSDRLFRSFLRIASAELLEAQLSSAMIGSVLNTALSNGEIQKLGTFGDIFDIIWQNKHVFQEQEVVRFVRLTEEIFPSLVHGLHRMQACVMLINLLPTGNAAASLLVLFESNRRTGLPIAELVWELYGLRRGGGLSSAQMKRIELIEKSLAGPKE